MTLPARPSYDSPVVRDGKIHRPVEFLVEELVVRPVAGKPRRLFWNPGGFDSRPWGEVPS